MFSRFPESLDLGCSITLSEFYSSSTAFSPSDLAETISDLPLCNDSCSPSFVLGFSY